MTLLFDIGATHMRLALATEEGIGPITHIDTPADPDEAVKAFKEAADALGTHDRAIGGIAGIVLPDGSITGANNLPQWEGYQLREALGDVELHNDAELNGLGEATYGAGKGYITVAYMGLGTGVGTSLIINRVVTEHSSDGAMRERIVELRDGSDLEVRIGGRSLEEEYGQPSEEFPLAVWGELLPYLVEGVENALEAWKPDVLVLGGSLMSQPNGFSIEAVREAVHSSTPIVQGTLGDASGLWGGRALV